jgi:hypothetical protein
MELKAIFSVCLSVRTNQKTAGAQQMKTQEYIVAKFQQKVIGVVESESIISFLKFF